MSTSAMLLSLLLAVTAQPGGDLPSTITLKDCLIGLDEEAEVPAQEAGVLIELPADEGDFVKADDLLAKIDDRLPLMEYRVAKNKWDVSKLEAKNDTNVRFAKAATEVALADCRRDASANRDVKTAVPQADVEKHILEYQKSQMTIEVAKMNMDIAGLQSNVAKAEMDAADNKVQRRQIKSPLEGQIRKIYRHQGEWVQAGEPVMHVVRVNRLRVQAYLNASKFAPNEVIGRPVTIKAKFARGREETFSGKIVYVDPMVESRGEFAIYAEIQNREENGVWLLRAGMDAEMTIHLK
jgi:multidrug resistance efflux pump